MEGNVGLQLSAKSVGLFEAFYNSVKPIQLMFYSIGTSCVVKGGKRRGREERKQGKRKGEGQASRTEGEEETKNGGGR